MVHKTHLRVHLHWILLAAAVVLLGAALLLVGNARVGAQGPNYHPPVPLLDAQGQSVLESGNPVSTMKTCGACHDTEFIERHSFHADVGLSTITAPGQSATGLPWDFSNGLFGLWNPLTYRYLSPSEDARVDLTTAEWLQVYGPRHVGGGPAFYSRDNATPLTEITGDAPAVERSIVDPATGELQPWDWTKSGTVEMNCFLCHLSIPNNDARVEALRAGDFAWANTATLLGTGVVEKSEDGMLQWAADAFDETGAVGQEYLTIQEPTNEHCGQCHGLVHAESETPLVLEGCTPAQWSTITTGQIYSPQRLLDTGLNFQSKDDLSRSWDIHAERVLDCTECHYAVNNPIYYQEPQEERPDHLRFDPRRISFGEYLYRPLHQFAKGQSAQSRLATEFDNTMRRCESCHDADASHDWLPYRDRHMMELSCETCHVPQLYSSARQYNDWTVLQLGGTPHTNCRGVEEQGETFGTSLFTGYQPVLLPRAARDGSVMLAPFNLITSWYWVYGDPPRPVSYRDLRAAWLNEAGDAYQADVLALFDADGDGVLSDAELVIDTDKKEALIAERLAAQGLEDPRIMGDVRPYTISHNVAGGDWAIRDCQVCHSKDSRINAPLELADRVPGGAEPIFVSNGTVYLNGAIVHTEDGRLLYQPRNDAAPAELYIFGHDGVAGVDWLGALMFVGVLFGVGVHSTLRYVSARRNPPQHIPRRREYMYTVYERQWHWLQTVTIILLLFTGLIIHKPDIFGIFSFSFVVQVHNVLAAILVLNAALALFYHLASGEIRQFLPQPRGFFNQAVAQSLYYLRGIFKGEPHPFEKTSRRKMNPLQQLTYLMILNVLLPLQILTGALMWGAQTWPDVAGSLGGLGFLAPLHTLGAWMFASFIVAHVYLTTTAGHAPLDGIRAMITGWDEVEVHDASRNEAAQATENEG